MRSDHERIRHFQVVTHPATVDETVREILDVTSWPPPAQVTPDSAREV